MIKKIKELINNEPIQNENEHSDKRIVLIDPSELAASGTKEPDMRLVGLFCDVNRLTAETLTICLQCMI